MLRALVAAAIFLVTASTSFALDPVPGRERDNPGLFVVNRPANLYSRPSADAKIVSKLRPNTVITVTEVQDQWYKVRSQTGKAPGWIRRSYADPQSEAGRRGSSGSSASSSGGERRRFKVGTFRLQSPSYVYAEPTTSARKVGTLKEGQEVRVVDKNGLWYRIESERGDRPPGYIPTEAAKRVSDAPASSSGGRRATPDPYDDPNFDPRE